MMPSKKKKYNARFPAGRIKKIMQTDEDVGKVAQAVPVIISRALELFVESLLTKAMEVTSAKNAKTLTPSHMKQCILSESRFDFLKDLVNNISDVSACDEDSMTPQPAGISNPFPPAPKRTEGGTTRARGRPSGSTRTTSTRNALLTSLEIPPASRPQKNAISSQPSTPATPTTPSFYRELPIGGDEEKKESVTRPPVIQHTANHRSYSNESDEEDEEEEDEVEVANGFRVVANHSANHLLIDEDYDT